MRLLCFGDSNTYGYDPRSYFGGRYPAQVRWADRLAQSTGWEVLNFGSNGQSIPGGTAQLPEADAFIVMLGSNDLLSGYGARQTADRMERFLTPLLPCYARTLLVAPPPMQYGDWVTDEGLLTQSALLVACYEALAEKLEIPFADSGKWNVGLTFDGVHFSEAGHAAFAEGLLNTLNQIIQA